MTKAVLIEVLAAAFEKQYLDHHVYVDRSKDSTSIVIDGPIELDELADAILKALNPD